MMRRKMLNLTGFWAHGGMRRYVCSPLSKSKHRLQCDPLKLTHQRQSFSLNLVILRTSMVYGPYVDYGSTSESSYRVTYYLIHFTVVMVFMAVAATYGYSKQPMKAL